MSTPVELPPDLIDALLRRAASLASSLAGDPRMLGALRLTSRCGRLAAQASFDEYIACRRRPSDLLGKLDRLSRDGPFAPHPWQFTLRAVSCGNAVTLADAGELRDALRGRTRTWDEYMTVACRHGLVEGGNIALLVSRGYTRGRAEILVHVDPAAGGASELSRTVGFGRINCDVVPASFHGIAHYKQYEAHRDAVVFTGSAGGREAVVVLFPRLRDAREACRNPRHPGHPLVRFFLGG